MVHKSCVLASLLVALMATSAVSARAFNNHSNKNMLKQRAQHTNAALEYTTWHHHLNPIQPDTIRTNLHFAPFFQQSQNGIDLGQYFGIGNGKNSFRVGLKNAYPGGNPAAVAGDEIDAPLIIHDHRGVASYRAAADISFKPELQQYGARIDLFQDVDTPCKGMFFRAGTTALQVESKMGMQIANEVTEGNDVNLTLGQFFAGQGNDAQATGPKNQVGLSKARIPAGHRSKAGFADLDLSLGYKCVHTQRSHVFVSLDVTVPTGNRVRGDYVFEAVIGNGHHFGLGATVDGGVEVWKNDVGTLRFEAVAHYKYLFENNEQRTLSLVDRTNASKYFLVGKLGAPQRTPLLPLANISTVPVAVKPGHQLDMLAALSFNSGKFTIDVGYNPFWRDAESVHLNSFGADSAYGLIKANYNVPAGARLTTTVGANAQDPSLIITRDTLDLDGVITPALFTHKLFAGAGYTCNFYGKNMLSMGIGASYEIATSNADIEQYALWGKLGVSF